MVRKTARQVSKTGKTRKTPLVRVHDGEHYIVIASMGGAPDHPNWYRNLVDDPDVVIQDRAEVHELGARTATPEEKQAKWPTAVAA